MNRPTPFDTMRANRPKLRRARHTLLQRISRLEREVTAPWHIEIDELTALAAQEQQAQLLEGRVQQLERWMFSTRRQRWWQFWKRK